MRFVFAAIALVLTGISSAQGYSHNYESFFGKEDRIGLYSKAASERFSPPIIEIIRDNTLLMDCGSNGKPSTAFVVKMKGNTHIVSAAHNLTLAKTKAQSCKLGKTALPAGQASSNFKDNGMKSDAAHDIAFWSNITSSKGFDICETVTTASELFLVQSLDGTGRLGISPQCKIKSIEGKLITTTCRGHYKASGAPLLSVSSNNVCAIGVFNAHTGKLFNYESYAARLTLLTPND